VKEKISKRPKKSKAEISTMEGIISDFGVPHEPMPGSDLPTFGDRLQANQSKSNRKIPKKEADRPTGQISAVGGSIKAVLEQALTTNNRRAQEKCFSIGDPDIIRNTARKLTPEFIPILIRALSKQLKHSFSKGYQRTETLLLWLQIALVEHAPTILRSREMAGALLPIHHIFDHRLTVFRNLLKLSGRLDLLLSQVGGQNRRDIQQPLNKWTAKEGDVELQLLPEEELEENIEAIEEEDSDDEENLDISDSEFNGQDLSDVSIDD